MTSASTQQTSAWREPMVWLVAAIPAMSIVAGVGLLVVAIRAGGADSVSEPVRRTAQIQVSDLSPDARASALRLRAVVRTGKDGVEIFPVDGEFDRQSALSLQLQHPIDASEDREIPLRPTETGWRGGAPLAVDHAWNITLSPADGSWRLQGRWPARQQAALLQPALGAPP